MPNAFAELSADGAKIEVFFQYHKDLHASIKEVPGARYVPPTDGGPKWTVPLNLDIARRLNEEMGPRTLVLGRALKTWGVEARKREDNLHALASIDSLEPKDLKLYDRIPELAEWFRGYQRADVKFLAETSCLNLNEQGLGKTTEIIGAMFEADLDNGQHLVVAPKTSLETVWRMEIERWTENIEQPHEVITYSGEMTHLMRITALKEFNACVAEDWPVWLVVTPNTLTTDFVKPTNNVDLKEVRNLLKGILYETEWNSFTIDEYHKTGLPNASAKRGTGAKFADSVRDIKSKRRYAMTGTPMGGRPIKLWGALHFLYPQQFTAKWQWAKTWLEIKNNGFGDEAGSIQRGREDEFYKSLAPYVVRRLKSEVLPQLPPKQYVDVWCEMTPKQKKQYDQFARAAEVQIEELQLNALGILSEYTRLKIFADAYCDDIIEKLVNCSMCGGTGKSPVDAEYDEHDPNPNRIVPDCTKCLGSGKRTHQHLVPSAESGKLEYLLERLAEAGIDPDDPSGDAQAIVSSQFKEVADMVHKYLNEKGIKAEKITGDTKGADRAEIQRRFQAGDLIDDAPRVVVMTTTAGGVAITLDRADTVHILDETWVPDDQEQLEDRAHRASRMHQVTVYYYRSRGTVEEQIHELVKDKAKINNEVLNIRRAGFRADMKEKHHGE